MNDIGGACGNADDDMTSDHPLTPYAVEYTRDHLQAIRSLVNLLP